MYPQYFIYSQRKTCSCIPQHFSFVNLSVNVKKSLSWFFLQFNINYVIWTDQCLHRIHVESFANTFSFPSIGLFAFSIKGGMKGTFNIHFSELTPTNENPLKATSSLTSRRFWICILCPKKNNRRAELLRVNLQNLEWRLVMFQIFYLILVF